MLKTITLQEASTIWLQNLDKQVAFFDKQLLSFLIQMRDSKNFEGKKIVKLRKDANPERLFREIIEFLENHNFIQATDYNYYLIKNKNLSEMEIICSLYPYGYISHLTAMRMYNLTNRFPKLIDFTVPTRSVWKKNQSMSKNDFLIPFPSEVIKFKRKKLNLHSRKDLMPFVQRGQNIRVIEIGCLFLEMLRFPSKCGGFQHVFEIFEEMGDILSEEILTATEIHGNNMDKSRVGFIFEKCLGITDDRIQNWKITAVSRGGSRKIIAEEPYSNIYDEEWNISLNHVIFG